MEEVAYKPVTKFDPKNNTYIEQKDESLNPIWIAKNRQQITRYGYISGLGNQVIYTVPENMTLFVTGISINLDCTGTGTGAYAVAVGSLDTFLGVMNGVESNAMNTSCCNDFLIPIRFQSGEQILLQNTTNATGLSCVIFGWLEPNPTA